MDELAIGPARPRPWTVFASSSFRKLWVGATLSMFGDFFSYVALAWLVLQLTGSSLALGSVLVAQALPRAALILVGGAISDRLSQRVTMLGSMGLRTIFVAPLAVLVLTGRVQMWEVYSIAVVFGIVDAFFLPASSSILPKIVADHELEPANAVRNVTLQASVVLGPALGGVIVAAYGTGWAFAADAACFAVGFFFVLWLPRAARSDSDQTHPDGGLLGQIAAGFRYAWSDIGIRVPLIVIAVVDFAAIGAIGVGLPILARGRFAAGAAGFGAMVAAWGVGATIGALAAGFVPVPKRFGWLVVAFCFWMGAGIAVVGALPSLLPATLTMGVTGIASGVINTYGVSWLQRRTDPAMQGRVMSLVVLASLGLTPVSYAVSGAIAELNPTLLFAVAGGIILVCGAGAASSRAVRSLR